MLFRCCHRWHALKCYYLNASDNIDNNATDYFAAESSICMSGHGVMNLFKFLTTYSQLWTNYVIKVRAY